MNTHLHSVAILVTCYLSMQQALAQNTAPYWSLAGNTQATTSSKLGTTNNVALKFYTNNVQRMVIGRNTGNVGIGTRNPTERLHIFSPFGVNAFRVQVAGNTKLLVHSRGGVSVGANVTPPANGLYVAGKVGIGTTASDSAYKMNVEGGLKVHAEWPEEDDGAGSYAVYAEGATGVYGKGGWTGVEGNGYAGVLGSGTVGVWGTGQAGVYGEGSEDIGTYGVLGYCSSCTAVYGMSDGNLGVHGYSADREGGFFESENGNGLAARTTSGTYAGAFYGAVFVSSTFTASDQNLKQDVQEFEGAMSIIGKLKPRQYNYKNDEKYAFLHLPKGSHYGLLAQDVEEVLPELVSTAEHQVWNAQEQRTMVEPRAKGATAAIVQLPAGKQKEESVSLKAVNYIELIPILVKGMQEQQQENVKLKARIANLEELVSRLTGNQISTLTSTGTLGQNVPNPVKTATRISYSVAEGNNSAQLLITDVLGKSIKTVPLSKSGTLNLDATSLSSGTYYYLLIVDGITVDTKKMVVVHNN